LIIYRSKHCCDLLFHETHPLKKLNSNIYTGNLGKKFQEENLKMQAILSVLNIWLFGRYLGGKFIWARMGRRCGGGLRKMGLSPPQ